MRHSIWVAALAGFLLTSCSDPPRTPPVSTYLMGEKVHLGKLSYTFLRLSGSPIWARAVGAHAARPLLYGPLQRDE